MKPLRLIPLLFFFFYCVAASGQPAVQTVLILPFENQSKAPGLEWIAEAFPEVIGEGMNSRDIYVVPRQDREYAFDRMGVPSSTHLSRQTLYRISEQMDADFVVLGAYNYDGQTFTASAQLLDMKKLYLGPELKESGPLVNMVEIQRSVSWQLLKALGSRHLPAKNVFLEESAPVRLDAFENYIRGIIANGRQERIQRFREAIRVNPSFTRAVFQLAKTYFDNKEYESAASWFSRIPRTHALAGESSFYLGLSEFYSGNYEKSENAFKFLESRFPLAEVNNNLGVVMGRRGKRSELEYLRKAVEVDPNDPDYHFNIGVAYARIFDDNNAVRELKEALRLRPSDAEAKSLLDSITGNPGTSLANSFRQASAQKLPLQRVKRNYDETSFRSLALEIERAAEARLVNTDPKQHAAFHVERGQQFLTQGFDDDARKAFQEAIVLDPTSSEAHTGMAQIYESEGKTEQAVAEANAALRLQPTAAAFLVLARVNLKDNKLDIASEQVTRALALDAKSKEALTLKRTIDEKLAAARN
ncbi:MAG TPA: tetratricopeptide repeat protein [Terriglobales bacterium]|nr:tetratricopeptide repeat protein [Terriglobales bacterium]